MQLRGAPPPTPGFQPYVGDNVFAFVSASNNVTGMSFARICDCCQGESRVLSFFFMQRARAPGSVKLFVAGLPRNVTDMDLRALFGEFGEICETVLIREKTADPNAARGRCAFVMSENTHASIHE